MTGVQTCALPIFLYLLNGSDDLENFLQGKDIYISFITELELISFKGITEQQENQIAGLSNDCSIVQMNKLIKEKYVDLRRKYRLKLADAIIAASSIAFDMPLITADKDFKNIGNLKKLITYRPEGIKLADRQKD